MRFGLSEPPAIHDNLRHFAQLEMNMFNHVMVGANDVEESKKFYDAVLGALGTAPGVVDAKGRCLYPSPNGTLMIKTPLNGERATHGNGGTIGFVAQESANVDAWHAAGVANGGTSCEDPPGLRANGAYLAYLKDPAGNKLCAVYRAG
jgi:catechol 2,3-dioxygenase-like lactoylglutathione lyase family enzyme